MKRNNVKIVVVTSGGMNGRRLTHLFSNNNIPYKLLTVSFPLPKKRKKRTAVFFKNYFKGQFSNLNFLRKLKMRNLPAYPIKDEFVGRINENKMLKRLNEISPDYIFMMGGGILKDSIINTAAVGVLNAHPAILPFVRGVDVVNHAILNDIPIGITSHYIDAGIDTGQIIDRYYLPIDKNTTYDNIINKSNDLSVAAMMKLALEVIEGKEISTINQSEKYKLFKRLNVEESKRAVEKFKNEWFKIHDEKIKEIKYLNSGKPLLDAYESWWLGIKRF